MRSINVSAPLGKSQDIAKIAFAVGIEKVSIQKEETRRDTGESETKEIVKIETSTPKGKRFIDGLLQSDFYDPEQYSFVIRVPRTIINREGIREMTVPLPETSTDVLEELFQFSHITYSFVGRVFVAATLLAYGMVRQNLLLMIAGLLFLPLLPLLQAIGFGAWTRHWKLFSQGLAAFVVAVILLVVGGMVVAGLSSPPIRFDEFGSPGVGFLISLVVGVAAGLALIDDIGKREMIGLAASSQMALVPVWLGICAIFGFPETVSQNDVIHRVESFFINTATIIAASLAVHILTGTTNSAIGKIKD